MHLACSSLPITALAFLRLDKQYLLVGEGQHLKLLDLDTRDFVSSQPVFAAQSIHGILSSPDPSKFGRSGLALIWGGRSVAILRIVSSTGGQTSESCSIEVLVAEVKTQDWILGASFSPPETVLSQHHTFHAGPVLITAHNDLLVLEGSASDGECRRFRRWASGPKSLLYSSHLCWKSDQELLVASGAVTGEVIVWSPSKDSGGYHLPSLLQGHEGSVFGVRISGLLDLGRRPVRLVCSCSDDRTIRLWDITDLEYSSGISKADCVASVMGHGSRIWSVQFAGGNDELPNLVSFGEDGTAQTWQLSPEKGNKMDDPDRICPLLSVVHKSTYSYHSGKNLWAHTIFDGADEEVSLTTGAADSRLVVYNMDTRFGSHSPVKKEISMQEAQSEADKSDKLQMEALCSTKSRIRAVFDDMKGEWILSRSIRSALPSQPSGDFEGWAILEPRDVTDAGYDAELIYHEQGEFTSNNIPGLKMSAKRSYVYRYQKKSDQISVWFVKLDGKTVDYLFHILDFPNIPSIDLHSHQISATRLTATGHHLCEKDTYDPEYDFHFADSAILSWRIKYSVRGPQKDYVSVADYTNRQPAKQVKVDEPSLVVRVNDSMITNSAPTNDSFKAYAWITSRELLATTAQGNVFLGILNKSQHEPILEDQFEPLVHGSEYSVHWERVGSSIELKSTSMISTDVFHGLALLTGNNASIHIYQHSLRKLSKFNPDNSKGSMKIGFLKVQTSLDFVITESRQQPNINLLTRSLGSQHSNIYRVTLDASPTIQLTLQIPTTDQEISDEFVTTSSWMFGDHDLVVEGSRQGALRIHSLLHHTTRTVEEVHGEETITAILPLVTREPGKAYHVLTTGRDGKYACHRIRINDDQVVDFQTIHITRATFGPNIEGAHINPRNLEITIWGFNGTRFVVWNESDHSELMSVECGGAHRHWSYFHHSDTGGGSFVWTKASSCNVYYQTQPSHRVLQQGGHGREITAMSISPLLEYEHAVDAKRLIATGAEDTTIRLFQFHEGTLKCLHIMREHTTGVQNLLWSPDGRWLFSAGGCEEFFAWRVRRLKNLICVVCVARCPPVTEEKDLRVTDFALDRRPSLKGNGQSCRDYTISIVYSDSSIRTWNFIAETESFGPRIRDRFTLVSAGTYGTNCLTQIETLDSSPSNALCTASSDGHLALWKPSEQPAAGLTYSTRHRIHQNSITSMLTVPITSLASTTATSASDTHGPELRPSSRNTPHPLTITIIITGGDDQALAITTLTTPPYLSSSSSQDAMPPSNNNNNTTISSSTLIPNAHASAITALAYLGCHHHTPAADDDGGVVKVSTKIRFASVGNDQRLKTWMLTISDQTSMTVVEEEEEEEVGGGRSSNMTVEKVGDWYTGVADAASLDAYNREEDDPAGTQEGGGGGGGGGSGGHWKLVVAGIGMEVRDV